jgi:hypothetical protein
VGARAVTREMRDDLQGNMFSDWVVFGRSALNLLMISADSFAGDFGYHQETTLFLTFVSHVTWTISMEILYYIL